MRTQAPAPTPHDVFADCPDRRERKVWAQRLGASTRIMAPPLHVCIARIKADAQRHGRVPRMVEGARHWWQFNSDTPATE